jgi:hypothetical protein
MSGSQESHQPLLAVPATMGSSIQSEAQPPAVGMAPGGAGRCSTARVGVTTSLPPRIDPTPSTIKE